MGTPEATISAEISAPGSRPILPLMVPLPLAPDHPTYHGWL
jgi:hypothetical protein